MAKSVEGFQYGEQYDTNGIKIKNGTYGKNTPFVTSDNTGILDYIIENFRVLKDGVDSKDLSIYLTIAKAQTQYQPKGNYETVEGASSKYQPKGSYLTSHQNISHLLTKTEAQSLYQPKGNYLTSHQDISHLLSKSDAQKTYETVVHSNENLQSAKSYADAIVSYGTNWIKFKGGKVIQWGSANAQSDKSWKTTFPIAFKNKPNVLCGNTDWYSGETVTVSYATKYNEYFPNLETEAVFVKKVNNTISTSGGIFYIAIGDY